uniref:Uncharacterized protein n=1 Tax=Glossina brevipalpis TaxID=37001 RepID=A0A1A9W7G0_9MUSC
MKMWLLMFLQMLGAGGSKFNQLTGNLARSGPDCKYNNVRKNYGNNLYNEEVLLNYLLIHYCLCIFAKLILLLTHDNSYDEKHKKLSYFAHYLKNQLISHFRSVTCSADNN